MSYPRNKRERFLIGKRKGRKRVALWFYYTDSVEERMKDRERSARYRRNITKMCSHIMCCGNPRRRGELTFQELRFLDSLTD